MYELAPQIYTETNFHNSNPGFIVTSEGVICIDSPLIPEEAKAWRQTIEEVSGGLPILYVIISDHHRGHCLGSQWLSETVIAHELAWKHMRNYSDNFKQRVRDSFKKQPEIRAQFDDLRIIVPKITFQDNLTIVRGDRVVRALHVGGHTPATSMTWFPVEKVLFAGDIVWIDQHPFMTQANSADWLEALDFIRTLEPRLYRARPWPVVRCHSPRSLSRVSVLPAAACTGSLQCRAHQTGNRQPAYSRTQTLVPDPFPPVAQNRIPNQIWDWSGIR